VQRLYTVVVETIRQGTTPLGSSSQENGYGSRSVPYRVGTEAFAVVLLGPGLVLLCRRLLSVCVFDTVDCNK